MKRLRKILLYTLLILVFLVGFGAIAIYTVLQRSLPVYEGTISSAALSDSVKVSFDEYGVPHISANSAEDAYFVLGYLHAQERLFQFELLRRAGDGRLSELLGADLLKADELLITFGLRNYNKRSVAHYNKVAPAHIKKEMQAYMDGMNQFIANDQLPPEYVLLGAECKPVSINDLFAVQSYMAFSFALGQKTDPIADYIYKNYGTDYLKGVALEHYSQEPYIPNLNGSEYQSLEQIEAIMSDVRAQLPLPFFSGSNSWAVNGSRTSSGSPILCNDTHMGHGMPSIWYETHIEYLGYKMYGNHIPGIPYALIGHTDHHAWGLTMLEQDDIDFYMEKPDDEKMSVQIGETWHPIAQKDYTIDIKNAESINITVDETPHGPIINGVLDLENEALPVSMWWEFTKHDNNLIYAFYDMHHAVDFETFKQASQRIHGPGLNVQYADIEDNIAWLASAFLLKRAPGVNSKLFQEGWREDLQPLGYYDVDENPNSINPESGVIYSANDQPGPMPDSTFYPGYYKPHHRGERIYRLLSSRSDWDTEKMKELIDDVTSDVDASTLTLLLSHLNPDSLTEKEQDLASGLNWNGSHELDQTAPAVYYKWLYHILADAMEDEMGEKLFESWLSTHWMKRAYPVMLQNAELPWWDDINTDKTETMDGIITYAFKRTVKELEAQFGADPSAWTWNKARHLELKHPMGKVKPLNLLFNVGPGEMRGGHETISQTDFDLNPYGFYTVRVGPQMRIVHDLGSENNSWSVLPSGQSGHPLSPHYDDQFDMYRNGEFRHQYFKTTDPNWKELVFTP